LEVAECPVGRYSDSQNRHSDTAARCVTCPAGSVAEETGSTDVTQCTGEDGMQRGCTIGSWGSAGLQCLYVTSTCSDACHDMLIYLHASCKLGHLAANSTGVS
jgi:hypothetical protein